MSLIFLLKFPLLFVTTVHKDVSERLPKIQPQLHSQVKEILELNKRERHIRGGQATKLKYEEKNKQKVTT